MALHYGFFKDLINIAGPSGYEQNAVALWKKEVKKFCSDIREDNTYSGIARMGKKGGLRLMISTHIDEIGYMIKYIDKEGYLYFETIGGIDRHIMPGTRVRIQTKKGPVLGVLGRKPVHLISGSEKDAVSKIENMWIDIGVENEKEAKKLVEVGDCAVPDVGYEELGKHRIVGKGFDDRASVFVMTETLRELANHKFKNVELYGVASTQEELGLRGARVAAFGIDPEIGVAIDVTFASDCPGIDKRTTGDVKLGQGVVVTRGPNIHYKVSERFEDVAKKSKTKIQIEACGHATGTDANAIQMTRAGVKTGLLSIPNRYMHTPVEVVDKRDLDAAVKLMVAFVKSIDEKPL